MPDSWELASVLVRFLLYLGILGSVGLVLIRTVFKGETGGMHRRITRQAAAFALLALLTSVLGFALKGAAMTGEASGLTDPEMLDLLWQTPVGTALAIRAVGLALVLAGLWIRGFGLPIAAAGGIVALWSFSRVGHVPDLGSFWFEILLLLHLAVAAFWIGILSPLRKMAGEPESLPQAARLGHRFGQIAAFAVPGLIIAGVVMAWLLLGEILALVTTAYGVTLLAKVGGVACLLGTAAANKLRFVRAMRIGDHTAALRLRRSIALEWTAVCFILFLTAVLTTLPDLPSGGVS